jgi:hypothetical protein
MTTALLQDRLVPLCFTVRLLREAAIWMVLLVGALGLSGCAVLSRVQWPAADQITPQETRILSVPFYPQARYQCGPAALAMALTWSGLPTTPRDLIDVVYSPRRKGSLQLSLVAAARRAGRVAYTIHTAEALLAEVAAGNPVIVLQNLGLGIYPVWHYSIVYGYDLQQGQILMHSGTTAEKIESLRVFGNTWSRSDRWGLLVLPPGRLPVTADESGYLTAVAALERSGNWQACQIAYEAARALWPESATAAIGLANVLYAQGNLAGAEIQLRQAALRFPTNATIQNNFAQVLWERNQHVEAIEHARKAVQLGGPLVEHYRQTLQEMLKTP